VNKSGLLCTEELRERSPRHGDTDYSTCSGKRRAVRLTPDPLPSHIPLGDTLYSNMGGTVIPASHTVLRNRIAPPPHVRIGRVLVE
jgi:hypothetical protein